MLRWKDKEKCILVFWMQHKYNWVSFTLESMSSYMAYEASTKKPESQRTVISNIHKNGLPPVEAGAQIVHLIEVMMREKNSGVELFI